MFPLRYHLHFSDGNGSDLQPSQSRTRIRSLDELRPADHIAWHRPYVIWHHGIVKKIHSASNALTIINYTVGRTTIDRHISRVREEVVQIDLENDELYRYNYKDSECLSPNQVIARAESRKKEHEYNPFTNNCEHFARWCKSGHKQSSQARTAVDRLAQVGVRR